MNSPTNPHVIRSEDSEAVPQLQAKIVAAEKLQATMKAANAIVRNRKLADDDKVAQLVGRCGLRETNARQLLQPDFMGRIGFPDYQLTNNGANIRRMQQRLRTLAGESNRESVTLTFPGGRVEDNAEEFRVRIYHEVKPPADTIAKLKASRFHWTPTLGCWQRLRSDSARHAAERITGVQWPVVTPAATAEAVRFDGPTVAVRPTTSVAQGVRSGVGV